MSTIEHQDPQWYAQLAERATENALYMIRSKEDASAELSLASVAWNVAMGTVTDEERSDMDEYVLTDDGGYEHGSPEPCVCPPDLLARGGFRGACPVHA